MKKYLTIAMLVCFSVTSISQSITASSYPFTFNSNVTGEDMNSGTTQLIGPNTFVGSSGTLNDIGFDFRFSGTRYTQFDVASAGFLRLGSQVVPTPNDIIVNELFNTNQYPIIAPYWDYQKVSTAGKVHSKVVGTAPNRKLVIEWKNMIIPALNTDDENGATYQLWLAETTGQINFVYVNGLTGSAGSGGASIGLGSIGFASVTSSNNTVSYNSINNANTSAIVAASNYRFAPTIPNAPTNLTFSTIRGTATTLNWVDNATNESGFEIYVSANGGVSYQFVTTTNANATSSVRSELTPGTIYRWRVVAVTSGGQSGSLEANQSTVSPSNITSNGTGGGNWSNTSTWIAGVVPTDADNVTIAANDVVTIDVNSITYNLTIASNGLLQFETTTSRSLEVAHDALVQNGGTIKTQGVGTITNHNLRVVGNLTNNGTLNLHEGTTSAHLVFKGSNNSLFSGSGTVTDIFSILTQKTLKSNLIEITTDNFSVRGLSANGTNGFWTGSAGTLKFSGTHPFSGPLLNSAFSPIGSLSTLWVNNPNIELIAQAASTTLLGDLHVSSGILNIGTTNLHNLVGVGGSTITIDGGTLNIASKCSLVTNCTYVQTAGNVNLSTVGNNTSVLGSFDCNNALVHISGGTITLVQANSNATVANRRDYICLPAAGSSFAGGTLMIGNSSTLGNAADFTFAIVGSTPGITVNNTTNPKSVMATSVLSRSGIEVNGAVLINLFCNFDMGGFSNVFHHNIINNGSITGSGAGSVLFIDGDGSVTFSGNGSTGSSGLPIHTIYIATTGSFTINALNNLFTLNLGLLNGNFVNANKLTIGNGLNDVTVDIGFSELPGGSPGYFDVQPNYNLGTGRQTLRYFNGNGRTMGFEINPSRRLFSLQTNMGTPPLIMAGGNVQVTGTFSFNSGKINLNGDTLTVGSGPSGLTFGGIVVGPTSVLFNGSYRKWIGNFDGTAIQFPVGIEANRRNVSIQYTTLPTTGGTLTAEWINSAGGSNGLPLMQDAITVNSTSPEGYWKVVAGDGLTGGSYKATFTAGILPGINDFTQLVLVKRTNNVSPWTLDGTHVTTTGTNEIPVLSRSNLIGFSEFGIGLPNGEGPLASALAASLLNFSATPLADKIEVKWQTASEVNSLHFVVQQSLDGINFSNLATVPAAGNTQAKSSYIFDDLTSVRHNKKVIYYRLQIVSRQLVKSYSSIIKVNLSPQPVTVQVYPNPVHEIITISFNSKQPIWSVKLVNLQGSLLKSYRVEAASHIQIPVQWLPSGKYFFQINDGKNHYQTQFIKQ